MLVPPMLEPVRPDTIIASNQQLKCMCLGIPPMSILGNASVMRRHDTYSPPQIGR